MEIENVNKEVLVLATKTQESINALGELLSQCVDVDEKKEQEFIQLLQYTLMIGKLGLSREQVLICFLSTIDLELQSLIGHLSLTSASEENQ